MLLRARGFKDPPHDGRQLCSGAMATAADTDMDVGSLDADDGKDVQVTIEVGTPPGAQVKIRREACKPSKMLMAMLEGSSGAISVKLEKTDARIMTIVKEYMEEWCDRIAVTQETKTAYKWRVPRPGADWDHNLYRELAYADIWLLYMHANYLGMDDYMTMCEALVLNAFYYKKPQDVMNALKVTDATPAEEAAARKLYPEFFPNAHNASRRTVRS